jgi:hypothetical protein
VVEDLIGRIPGGGRCDSLPGDGNVLVGETMRHIPQVFASGVTYLDALRRFGNHFGLLLINNNVLHESASLDGAFAVVNR